MRELSEARPFEAAGPSAFENSRQRGGKAAFESEAVYLPERTKEAIFRESGSACFNGFGLPERGDGHGVPFCLRMIVEERL